MLPVRPGDLSVRANIAANGATATHFMDFLIFGDFGTQPRGPLGPLGGLWTGAPWAPWASGAPWAAHGQAPKGPLGPLGPQIHCYGSQINSKPCQKIDFWALLGPKWAEKKFGFRPQDPHGEIGAGILCRIPVSKSQMVGWRPIWWQKGVIWGPLGFRAQPAHLAPVGM